METREEQLAKALQELLRLYDWRFFLAEREKDPRTATQKEFQKETSRLLRQYGTEKKAAWEAARAILLKPPAESELARLFNAADDDESNAIEAAALKAGLIWRCSDENCKYNNDESDTKCGNCGKVR